MNKPRDYIVKWSGWPHNPMDASEYPIRAYDARDAVEQTKVRWSAANPGINPNDVDNLRILAVDPNEEQS